MQESLLSYTPDALAALLEEYGQKPYRAKQLLEWIWKHRVKDFARMINLPPALRADPAAHASFSRVCRTGIWWNPSLSRQPKDRAENRAGA